MIELWLCTHLCVLESVCSHQRLQLQPPSFPRCISLPDSFHWAQSSTSFLNSHVTNLLIMQPGSFTLTPRPRVSPVGADPPPFTLALLDKLLCPDSHRSTGLVGPGPNISVVVQAKRALT